MPTEDMSIPIETEFSKKGETKFVPYESKHSRFRIGLFKEVWIKGENTNRIRGLHFLIQISENMVIVSGCNFWDVLHQAAKHLALLTEPAGET